MARGILGVKRLSDALPFVSEHAEPAAECAKEFCFNGMDKGDVFANIGASFLSHKDGFEDFLESKGADVDNIAIVGSLVRGDFGCRSMDRLDFELDGVAIELSNEGKATKAERNRMFELFDESDSQVEFIRKVKSEIGNPDMVDKIVKFMCSDIDIVVESEMSQRTVVALDKEYGFTQLVAEGIDSNLEPVELFAKDEIDTPSLSTEEDFSTILRRHY